MRGAGRATFAAILLCVCIIQGIAVLGDDERVPTR